MPCAISRPYRQLLSAREYIVGPYRTTYSIRLQGNPSQYVRHLTRYAMLKF